MTLEVVILALAVARLTRLVTTDTFPPIRKAREWVLLRWPDADTSFGDSEVIDGHLASGRSVYRFDGAWYATDPYAWSELLTCVWCASVWIGVIVWVAYLLYPVTAMIAAPFALSQMAGILDRP
jgi:hypothetical protein